MAFAFFYTINYLFFFFESVDRLWKPVYYLFMETGLQNERIVFMLKKNLVLNFLVFEEKVKKGVDQSDLIVEASRLGFEKVELRREYFRNLEKEIPIIKEVAERENIELFYSVPDEVFVNKKVNSNLKEYLQEARQMGVKHIKWNIGDFTPGISLEQLRELTATTSIEINIENDQTQTSGIISAIKKFMEAVQKENIPIGYVYDLGNWRFVGESEIEAAKILKDFVRFIHVKDVAYLDGKPQAAGLDHGVVDWREILNILPTNCPIAIEYPTSSNQEILEAKKLLEEV